MSIIQKAKTFNEIIEKFNPYHDSRGRFTGPGAAVSFTYKPGASRAHDMAIAREKERTKNMATASPGSEFGLTPEQHADLERKVNGSLFAGKKKAQELGMSDEDFERYKQKYKSDERRKQIIEERRQKEAEQQRQQREALDQRVKEELPGLSQEAINHANNVSMFDHGSVAAREALGRLDDYRERNKIQDDWTDEQKAYAKQREQEYKQLLTEYYNDSNRRFGDNPSWMVAGPANYNFKASQKKMNAAMNRASDYEDKLKRFEENTTRKLKSMEPEEKQVSYWRNGKWKNGETIDAADPLAEKKMQAKLDYLNESQQKMKDANAYYRRNKTMSGFEGFSESTNQSIDSAMQSGRMTKPFASYQLTNNNAQIKATQSRLTQLQSNKQKAAASGGSGGSTSFKGGSMIRNAEANRLQLKFDSIPDAATRQQLKSSGWRWSPKNGVWQRQLTSNAEYSANRIIESLNQG